MLSVQSSMPHIASLPSRFVRCTLLRGLVLLAAVFSIALPAHAQSDEVLKRIQTDGRARVVVRMKADTGAAAWSATQSAGRQRAAVASALENVAPSLAAARINAYKTFRTLPFVATTVDREQALSLMTSPDVASVTLVRRERKLESTQALEKALTAASAASIDIEGAWAKGYDGSGYAVAVIDDGFNVNHPMLLGKNTGDACFASDYGSITKNNCASGVTPQIGPGAASKCIGDSCAHGTHVASIAVGNDGVNFGIARGAKLVPINVFSTDTDPNDCSPDPVPCELTDTEAVLNALDYVNENAVALKIAAVNLSLGGSPRDGYCDEDPRKSVIDMLRQKGIAVAAAASNDGLTGKVTAPACISTAFGVGATDDGTSVAGFSNFASILDFMAPGVSIQGASNTGAGLITKSGTSMAAPHVAGAWAVLRSAVPNGTFDTMETALKQTGTAVTRVGSQISVPKIRVAAALDRLQGKDRRLLNNLLSSSAVGLGGSYLRFYNDSATAGTVTLTFRDAATGVALATWSSAAIPAHASPQYPVSVLESTATPVPGQFFTANTRPYYNVDVTSTFVGYMQHVMWSPTGGVFANLTSCAAGFTSDGTTLINVHTSINASYPSRLRVVNTGSSAATAVLTLYNGATGAVIGAWTSPEIAAGASLEVKSSMLETQLPALKDAVALGLQQYNAKLSSMTGYVQHAMESSPATAVTDMSSKCDIGTASTTPAVTTPAVTTQASTAEYRLAN